jgi:sodium-dependent dicarboxylate transporter 2/3/5
MYIELGAWSKNEKMALSIVLSVIVIIAAKNWVPALKNVDKTAILLTSTLLFFILNILKVEDLEDIPWNIILLFGGAMSIGFCLWQTHAAEWLAVNWLSLFKEAPAVVFILSIAFFVMIMTNFIMNVAAIAISLPVALVIAPYLGVAGHVIFFAALATAGMPFILLIGAAPNAIAYGSKQFTAGEFFRYGMVTSMILMFVMWLMVAVVWPLMGMPILLAK